jgi:hypothetical protein
MDETKNFLTKAKFSKKVESVHLQKKISYIEAVIDICEEHDIDPGQVKKFLNNTIKEKIEIEAKDLNFLPKGNELPI